MNPENPVTIRQPLRRALHALVLLTPLLATHALALPDDRSQPIRIQSDRAQIDQRQGVTVYEGDVHLSQGSMHIYAERLVIHTNSDNQVQKLTATGQPARLQQQPDADKSVIHASAEAIDYDVTREQILLTRNARLEQGGATMSGNRIDYDIVQDIVKVAGQAGTDQPRIEMVIPPQNREQRED